MADIYINADDAALAARSSNWLAPAEAVALAKDAVDALRLAFQGSHGFTQSGDSMTVDLGPAGVLKIAGVRALPMQESRLAASEIRWEAGGALRATLGGGLYFDYDAAAGVITVKQMLAHMFGVTMPDQHGGQFTIGGNFWELREDGQLVISKTELTQRPAAGMASAYTSFYSSIDASSVKLESLLIDYGNGQREEFRKLGGYFDPAFSDLSSKGMLANASGLSGADHIVVLNAAALGAQPFINSGGGNDHITVGNGSYTIDGGAGTDTVQYAGLRALSSVTRDGAALIVSNVFDAGGADRLVNAERVAFTDVTVAFDIDGAAGQAYRMYDSAFGRTPDRTGLASWIESLDAQTPLLSVAEFFLGSDEFRLRYGSAPDDEAFVRLLYRNVLDRAPDDEGLAFWSAVLQGGESRAELLASFSESGEHKAILTGVMQNGIEF